MHKGKAFRGAVTTCRIGVYKKFPRCQGHAGNSRRQQRLFHPL
jgi:hypothetical protein